MPELTADYYSVQQTIANALEDGTSTAQLPPGVWGKGRYAGTFNLASVTFAKSETLGMVTIPAGVIVTSVDILISATLATAVFSVGSTVAAAKYRALLVMTTPLIQWVKYQVAATFVTQAAAPISTRELILITNDATAAMPAAGLICMVVNTLEP